MTRPEFMGQFQRLCTGFTFAFTPEQAEAWFRRVGHVALSVWAESVTNLLCAERFPRDLDRVLAVVDLQAQAARSKAIQRDKSTAARVEAQLGSAESGIDPTLFQVIKAFAGREQVRKYQARVIADDDLAPTPKRLELARLRTEEARLDAVIQQGVPSLTNEDAYRLMMQYEPVPA